MKPNLDIRPLECQDIPSLIAYWKNLEPNQAEVLGVDLSRTPSPDAVEGFLAAQILLPIPHRKSYGVVWTFDGKPIGHSNTNPTQYGEEAWLHFHIWDPDLRKRGFGKVWLNLSLDHFFETLKLKRILAEPCRSNLAPHPILKACGFSQISTFNPTPGTIKIDQDVVCWERFNPWISLIKKPNLNGDFAQ